MDLTPGTSNTPKRKRGRPPANVDATLAMSIIKAIEKETDADEEKKRLENIEREERERHESAKIIEKARIEEAQNKIKRTLRENLKKQKEEKIIDLTKKSLESSSGKITWKTMGSGYKICGYVDDKIFFEITRSLNIFNLYIKNKEFLILKKTQSYQGCSMYLTRLKNKSEKLI